MQGQAGEAPTRRHGAAWLLAGLIALGALGLAAAWRPAPPFVPAADDYALELARLDQVIGALATPAAARDTPVTLLRELRYRRALLAGDTAALLSLAAETTGNAAADLLLQARLDLALHRWDRVASRLAQLPQSPTTQLLQAQALLQSGQSEVAAAILRTMADPSGNWEALAGLAGLQAAQGRYAEADALYAQAAEDLDVREMRAYSWILLQRGYLHFRRGDAAVAQRWYDRAEQAYAGHWLSDDYQAEALAAGLQFDAAIARYRQAIAKTPRPELQQALGDLYQFIGRPEEAKTWLDRAEQAYLAATEQGGTHYLHHLAHFYAESRPDGARAVDFARRELALRPTHATQALLAWALYRDGRFSAAREAMQFALAQDNGDSDIYRHAALIELALGNAAAGQDYLARAAAINPQPASFHVHR